jgi:hypothetical protein
MNHGFPPAAAGYGGRPGRAADFYYQQQQHQAHAGWNRDGARGFEGGYSECDISAGRPPAAAGGYLPPQQQHMPSSYGPVGGFGDYSQHTPYMQQAGKRPYAGVVPQQGGLMPTPGSGYANPANAATAAAGSYQPPMAYHAAQVQRGLPPKKPRSGSEGYTGVPPAYGGYSGF